MSGLRARAASGGSALGTMLLAFDAVGVPRILADADVDFVLIDLEHTGWVAETIRPLLGACIAAGVAPIARTQGSLRHLISPLLDAGAAGVMVPMVDDAIEAERVVRAARFAPKGSRGFGLLYPDQVAGGVADAISRAEDETLVILQIETSSGLEHVEDIAATPGVDCLWIGQFDLSIAMGIPGVFEDERMRAAEDRVLAACADAGIAAGVLVATPHIAGAMAGRGFRMIALGTDIGLYGQALRAAFDAARSEGGPR